MSLCRDLKPFTGLLIGDGAVFHTSQSKMQIGIRAMTEGFLSGVRGDTAFTVCFLHLIRRSGVRSGGCRGSCVVVGLQSPDCYLRHHLPLQQPFPTGTPAQARNDLL